MEFQSMKIIEVKYAVQNIEVCKTLSEQYWQWNV